MTPAVEICLTCQRLRSWTQTPDCDQMRLGRSPDTLAGSGILRKAHEIAREGGEWRIARDLDCVNHGQHKGPRASVMRCDCKICYNPEDGTFAVRQ